MFFHGVVGDPILCEMRAELPGATDDAGDVNDELVEHMDDLRARVRAWSGGATCNLLGDAGTGERRAPPAAALPSEAFAAQTTMILRQTERIHELDMQLRDARCTSQSSEGGADREANRAIIEAQAERISQLDSVAVRHAYNSASQIKTVLCWAEGFKELAAATTAVARRRQTEIDELRVLIGTERAARAGADAAAALAEATEVAQLKDVVVSLRVELDATRAQLKSARVRESALRAREEEREGVQKKEY